MSRAKGDASKRATDLVLGTIITVLTSPLWLAAAIAIAAGDGLPVFFRQPRIGRGGKPFRMVKFRTMRANNDDTVHREYLADLIRHGDTKVAVKLERDPRITRVGRLLRKTSVDELPQLLNVLRGDMSLVGPRPAPAYEVDLYTDAQRRRLEVKPGMTGLWQVRGRAAVPYNVMVAMDVTYVDTRTFWGDLKILLLTPIAVLTGRGAD
jgi:lipopolysaccharide/colanic/teichoic acid biosynthesis glycosyltransferase